MPKSLGTSKTLHDVQTMMHEHDLDRIAAHVSGLEDASALIESCPICREEFELQRCIKAELGSLDKPVLSQIEQQRIARAVRISVATPSQARFNRIAWGAVAASFVVLFGFTALLAGHPDGDRPRTSLESSATDSYSPESEEGFSTGPLGVPSDGGAGQGINDGSSDVATLDRAPSEQFVEFDSVDAFVSEVAERKSDTVLYPASGTEGEGRCDSQISGLILVRLAGRIDGVDLIGYLVETSTGREIEVLFADSCERYEFTKGE